jgi:hypothetical protein
MKVDASSPASPKDPALAGLLSADDYVRRRIAPGLGDPDYPILKDLFDLLNSVAPEITGEVFDYGCGGAPYRSLFSKCRRYVGADLAPGPRVDRVLKANGLTGEPNEAYDVVLSTQVLEHVKEPAVYLRECHRILRPGGQLLLTTHGMFEEHGCPYDFYRWTCNGLEALTTASGFQVLESAKLTTEIRAMVQLLNQMSLHLRSPQSVRFGSLLTISGKLYSRLALKALNWSTRFFPEQGKVPASNPSSLYACIYIRGKKQP